VLDEKLIQDELDRLSAGEEPQAIWHFFGPVDDESISAVEAKLGLVFPLSYRSFLKRLGVATYKYIDIYGICSQAAIEDFPHLDVAQKTNYLREWRLPVNVHPDDVVCVAQDDDGVTFYLDYNYFADHEAPVVAISGYFGPSVAARNFLEFLQILVQSKGAPNPFGLYIQ